MFDGNTFSGGVKSMARNTLPAVELVRSGKWTLDDVERWLNAVITDDPSYAQEIKDKSLFPAKAS